jgi:hypothetical protein
MKKIFISICVLLVFIASIYVWNYFKPFIACPSWYHRVINDYFWRNVYCVNDEGDRWWFYYSIFQDSVSLSYYDSWNISLSTEYTSKWYIYSNCEGKICESYQHWNFDFILWLKNLALGIWSRYWTWTVKSQWELGDDWLKWWFYKEYDNWVLVKSWNYNSIFKEWERSSYDNDGYLYSKINYSGDVLYWSSQYFYKNWNLNVDWVYQDAKAIWIWKWYDREWNVIDEIDYDNISPLNCSDWYYETRDYMWWILVSQICENIHKERSWEYRYFWSDWVLSEKWTYFNDMKTWFVFVYDWWVLYSMALYEWWLLTGEIVYYYPNWEISAINKINSLTHGLGDSLHYFHNWQLSAESTSSGFKEYYRNWQLKSEWFYLNWDNDWVWKSYNEDWSLDKVIKYNHWFEE